mmetsp:Transcript_27640/g.38596  ORF Transcript_27640/g.38596 Transcript_27640/m.38596 type:complete len:390 (-) Transcript_27640:186-1355(-)
MKRATNGITCFAFNKDYSRVALSPNNEEVHIYETNSKKDCKKWEATPTYILTEHTGVVSSIDWCNETGFLLTCAHDRNAYVWKFNEKENAWEPSLVLLRVNRAATMCRWSPEGNKFAVASSAKVVAICHYEEKHKWWPSKPTKKHKSTVLSVAWCPNNKFIVTGSTDYRCRIISAFDPERDSEDDEHGFGAVFKNQHVFGETLAEFSVSKAWVHDVAWSPSAFRLAFAGQGSTIHFVQVTSDGPPEVTTIRHNALPFVSVEFLSNRCVVASGFDAAPYIFMASDSYGAEPEWKLKGKVEKKKGAKSPKSKGKFSASRNMFERVSVRAEKTSTSPQLATLHQNQIIETIPFYNEDGFASSFATAGIDGNIFHWDLLKCGFKLAEVKDSEE